MKKIQKGFTLIELMIVVAIIGILAAVAIPAYQDYIVKAKLSKVVSTLDPIKTALAMYFQEQGGFPNTALAPAGDYIGGAGTDIPAAVTANGSVWASLGFGNYPTLPNEVKSMALHSASAGTSASNIAIILELQNIKVGSINGVYIALSPNTSDNNNVQGSIVPVTMATSNLANTDSISGASAINWYYGCLKGPNATAPATDAVVKNFFKNGNTVLTCV